MLILAHGLGGRSDLPVPLWMAMYGGAAAVIISFAALGAFWLTPRLAGASAGRPLPGSVQALLDARLTRVSLRAMGVLALTVTLAVAALGGDSSASNPAPTWLYVWFWVGLVPASLLVGPFWRLCNPLRAISGGIARLSGDPHEEYKGDPPERWGYWPAAVGLFVFVWLELVYDRADDPLTVFVFVSAYGLAQLIAASRYGTRWFDKGDGFEVYSTLIGHLSPLGRRADGCLVLRNPLDGLASLKTEPSLVAVVAVVLGSTAFDGLTRTEAWSGLTEGATGVTNAMLGTSGLSGAIAFVAVTYVGATRLSAAVSRRSDARRLQNLGARFVHSLIPIAIGYTVAHYFSLFVFQSQAGYILASDPLDRGWDLFGTGDLFINYTAVSTSAIALVQVGAIVAGHVVGVVAAHDRAVGLFHGPDKTRSQYSLLGVMVVYTITGIALLVGT